ncbi:MAG: hypothetical protein KAT68_18975 [Bacteroidales bacterium]|nr:hypothetical protein [Bacteroidales bacterium]
MHVLDTLKNENKRDTDLVVFLQATSPLRKSKDIHNAIQKLITDKADSLISGSEFEDF